MKTQSPNNEINSPIVLIHNNTVYDMLVFCDGSWDRTYKKTLRFLDSNAGAKILYIEKPKFYNPEEDAAKFIMINDYIHVLRPNVTTIDAVFKLLPYHVRSQKIPVGWFASTDFAHFSELIRFKSIITNYTEATHAMNEKAAPQKINTATFATRRHKSQFPVAS